jgi:hypothetical protein
MKRNDLAEWLLDSGGPIIRYLVAVEIRPGVRDSSRMTRGLLKSDLVQQWIERLAGWTGFNAVHGSKDVCFENVMGKLAQFGLRRGMAEFDRKCRTYLVWLQKSRAAGEKNVIGVFTSTLVASMLALAGYLSEPVVQETVLERLEFVHNFVRKGDYSIYAEEKDYRGIPKAFRHYPLVHPDLYPRGHFNLPWIYDIFAFQALYEYTSDRTKKQKVEKVISYIMHPAYQKLPDGYGIVLTGKNRYQVMGWNVWLPSYNGMHSNTFKMGCLIQRLELISHFPNALASFWFTSNLNRLEAYSTSRGTYVFPKDYIKEKRNTYYVTGGHMGLGENRRQKSALEIESSFWVMKIKRNMMVAS